MAGEISPPRFRFDRFLLVHSKQSHQKIIPSRQTQRDKQGEEAASLFFLRNARNTVPLKMATSGARQGRFEEQKLPGEENMLHEHG
jgi:hypothetical protein